LRRIINSLACQASSNAFENPCTDLLFQSLSKKLGVYTPFKKGDEAELPKIIANILINKDKAEEI